MKFDNKILRCLGVVEMFFTFRYVAIFVYVLYLKFDLKTCAVMPLEYQYKYNKLMKYKELI